MPNFVIQPTNSTLKVMSEKQVEEERGLREEIAMKRHLDCAITQVACKQEIFSVLETSRITAQKPVQTVILVAMPNEPLLETRFRPQISLGELCASIGSVLMFWTCCLVVAGWICKWLCRKQSL